MIIVNLIVFFLPPDNHQREAFGFWKRSDEIARLLVFVFKFAVLDGFSLHMIFNLAIIQMVERKLI